VRRLESVTELNRKTWNVPNAPERPVPALPTAKTADVRLPMMTAEKRKRSTLFLGSSVSLAHFSFAPGPIRSAIASGDLMRTMVFFWLSRMRA
jgi:hypothetical protein